MRHLIVFIMLFSLVGCFQKSITNVEYKDTTYGEMFAKYQYFNKTNFEEKRIISDVDVSIFKLDSEKNSIIQYTYFDDNNNFKELYFVFLKKDIQEEIKFNKENQLEILENIYNDELFISKKIIFDEFKEKINPHILDKLESVASDLIDKFL